MENEPYGGRQQDDRRNVTPRECPQGFEGRREYSYDGIKHAASSSGYRIVTTRVKRVAADEPLDRQDNTPRRAVSTDGFSGVY